MAAVQSGLRVKDIPGGSVKAEGLGDGPSHSKAAIAKLCLTMPPRRGDKPTMDNVSEPQT